MIFLKWKDNTSRSPERITANLLSYLSSKWYPNTIVGTNIYNILKMYSQELSSASLESFQLYKDLFIESVRVSTVSDRINSKIYENFGVLFDVDKLFDQDYEFYNFILQSYRQQLRFLSEAYFNSTTLKSIYQVGQSFNGVSPLVKESVRDVLGWKLQTVTGSVLKTGDKLIVLDNIIPRVGNIIYTTYETEEGNFFVYTYSKLGTNTKLLGNKRYNSGINCIYFLNEQIITGSVIQSIENVTKNVLKADIIPYYDYQTNIVVWKPSPMNIPSHSQDIYIFASGGFIYNKAPVYFLGDPTYDYTPFGTVPSFKGAITSNPLMIPSFDSNIIWYYDWSVLLRNDAMYKVYMRSYPQLPIPSTVYFKEYTPFYTKFSLLSNLVNSGSLSPINHLIFLELNKPEDLTRNVIFSTGSVFSASFIRGREPLKLGWKLSSGSLDLYASASLNLYNSDFLWEGWVYGIDNTNFSDLGSKFVYKYQESLSTSSIINDIPETNGYSISLKAEDNTFNFYVNYNSNIERVFVDISDYMSEFPYRPHYFACLRQNNTIYLQIDDRILGNGTITNIPNLPSGSLQIQCNSIGVGFDEIMLSTGSIGVGFLRSRFRESAPKVISREIPQDNTDSFHQFQFRVEANINEFELHQCSLRGVVTSSIPLPYFYIEGIFGYGDVYSEKYGIYL